MLNDQTPKRNPAAQLALSGTPIYLHNILIAASVRREEKDMSGQKSGTQKSDKGVKAKELNVSGFIPYSRKEWLTQIFNLAESEDGKGTQTKYRVACTLAEAINMREVQFAGEVRADENGGLLGWSVGFTLREVDSVAEKKAARRTKPKSKTQTEKAPAAQSQTATGGANSASQSAGGEQKDERKGWAKELDDLLS